MQETSSQHPTKKVSPKSIDQRLHRSWNSFRSIWKSTFLRQGSSSVWTEKITSIFYLSPNKLRIPGLTLWWAVFASTNAFQSLFWSEISKNGVEWEKVVTCNIVFCLHGSKSQNKNYPDNDFGDLLSDIVCVRLFIKEFKNEIQTMKLYSFTAKTSLYLLVSNIKDWNNKKVG